MIIPKFLVADNSEYPENIFIVHTESPRFILDVDSEEVEWLEKEPKTGVEGLIQQALDFYESELDSYEDYAEEDDE
ncbi:hypothetical protein [Viscerimonas tarda]